MSYTATGELIADKKTQVISDKFKKRQFVLIIPDGDYQQLVEFELQQDKTDLLDNCKIGDTLEVEFNLRGREWISPQNETKHFNTLVCWKVKNLETVGPNPAKVGEMVSGGEDSSDLPF